MQCPLTYRQLECVVHVANGLRVPEIATAMHLSDSSVQQTLNTARKRADAKTLPHLVSLVIASGALEWSDDDRERQLQDGNGTQPA